MNRLIDFQWVADIVKLAIEKLGTAGFVLSILFVLVTILVVTFRWSQITVNQRFVLIVGLVLIVSLLSAYVVLSQRETGQRPLDKPDLLGININTPRSYFEANFGKPILVIDKIEGIDPQQQNPKPTYRLEVYSTSDNLISTVTRPNSSSLLSYAVIFKHGETQYYGSSISAKFGSSIKYEDILMHASKVGLETSIIGSAYAPIIFLEASDDMGLFFFVGKIKSNETCPIKGEPEFFSPEDVEGCKFGSAPVIGFAKLMAFNESHMNLVVLNYMALDEAGQDMPQIFQR